MPLCLLVQTQKQHSPLTYRTHLSRKTMEFEWWWQQQLVQQVWLKLVEAVVAFPYLVAASHNIVSCYTFTANYSFLPHCRIVIRYFDNQTIAEADHHTVSPSTVGIVANTVIIASSSGTVVGPFNYNPTFAAAKRIAVVDSFIGYSFSSIADRCHHHQVIHQNHFGCNSGY